MPPNTKQTEEQIQELLKEAEKVDREDDDGQGTLIPKELSQKEKRKKKLKGAKDKLEARLK